jgi:hypothetical protein
VAHGFKKKKPKAKGNARVFPLKMVLLYYALFFIRYFPTTTLFIRFLGFSNFTKEKKG